MLATLVIGLREGLEASLIVGIIAAFLTRTNKSLRPMWFGVVAAIVLSIIVGVVLQLISSELPQAQQEGMESIIGLVAVAVVTGMIGWMNTHARNMRSELEASASLALRDGAAWGLAGMAFLAVLKEGFETSVFLLAAFQSSGSALAAGAGAVIGVGIAVGIGIGIYRGGVRLNLARFFRVTGFFLVVVAAGLVLTALRTAHEAGWILIGQQRTLDLSWLAPAGSLQAALITGVLGIPADPRLIEVLGWFAYLVPVLLYLLWPNAKRPKGAAVPRLQLTIAASLTVVAIVLAAAVALPGAYTSRPAQIVGTDAASTGTATLTPSGSRLLFSADLSGAPATRTLISASSGTASSYDGLSARHVSASTSSTLPGKPTTLSLDDLVTLGGGRLPIGFNASENPGPFTAAWQQRSASSIWFTGGTLLDASQKTSTTITLSGGGLTSTRVLTPATTATTAQSWTVASGYPAATIAGLNAAASATSELLLWKLYLPIALILAAIVLLAASFRGRRALHKRERASADALPVFARSPAHLPS